MKFKLIECALPVVMSLEAMDRALEQHSSYKAYYIILAVKHQVVNCTAYNFALDLVHGLVQTITPRRLVFVGRLHNISRALYFNSSQNMPN